MPNKPSWDLIVVGGGAAGFFAAITCAEQLGSNRRVLILEKTSKVLGKVKISGGGRCNVTHACYEPKPLAQHYPRGHQSLIGPFYRWGTEDTVNWFQQRGVDLKTEADGRMFPVTDSSQTIIDCLIQSATDAGVTIRTATGVQSVHASPEPSTGFHLTTDKGEQLVAHALLLATGGTRLAAGARLAEQLGHDLVPNVPSLFAFNISDPRLTGLPGISVADAEVHIPGLKIHASPSRGPLLITHHGLSGPGILKLSAWGAQELHQRQYEFDIAINWLPGVDVATIIQDTRNHWGKRLVRSRAPFEQIPKRLWNRFCTVASIPEECTWSQLGKNHGKHLVEELSQGKFHVSGKSTNKDEFVTCGGVNLNDVQLKSMESKLTPGLYFSGEILNIDGITGGFNFQNAWTSGFIAGSAVADSHS